MTIITEPVYLRCDLSPKVGIGHFQRLQALASYTRNPKFVIPKEEFDWALSLGLPHSQIIPKTQTNGQAWYQNIPTSSWIITDICYSGNKTNAETEIMKIASCHSKICVIDSMPPDHFAPVHSGPKPYLVVTPYFNAEHLRPKPPSLHWLFGSRFAILSPVYETINSTFPSKPAVLIACGGSDPTKLSLRCANAVSDFQGPITVVAGPMFETETIEGLQTWAIADPKRSIVVNPNHMAGLIAAHSIVIGRPGLIRYEAAAMGRHSILLSETNGYVEYFKAFDANNIAEVYFSRRKPNRSDFFNRLNEISTTPNSSYIFWSNKAALRQVPLGGAKRLIDILFSKKM